MAFADAKASSPCSLGSTVKLISGMPISLVRISTTFFSMMRERLTTRANCCLLSDRSMSMGWMVGRIEDAMYSGPTMSHSTS
jgi:hypothetical protein